MTTKRIVFLTAPQKRASSAMRWKLYRPENSIVLSVRERIQVENVSTIENRKGKKVMTSTTSSAGSRKAHFSGSRRAPPAGVAATGGAAGSTLVSDTGIPRMKD